MSLVSLGQREARRNLDRGSDVGTAATPDDPNGVVEALTKYLPTETVTLFVAAMAAKPALANATGAPETQLRWILYTIGAILTPLIYYLVAAGKFRAQGGTGTMTISRWPIIASTIAFLVWALSVPELLQGENARLLAAFAATFVSLFLRLFDPLFAPRA